MDIYRRPEHGYQNLYFLFKLPCFTAIVYWAEPGWWLKPVILVTRGRQRIRRITVGTLPRADSSKDPISEIPKQ
jgi:hypothetical protein